MREMTSVSWKCWLVCQRQPRMQFELSKYIQWLDLVQLIGSEGPIVDLRAVISMNAGANRPATLWLNGRMVVGERPMPMRLEITPIQDQTFMTRVDAPRRITAFRSEVSHYEIDVEGTQ